jgi:hypothetical protein
MGAISPKDLSMAPCAAKAEGRSYHADRTVALRRLRRLRDPSRHGNSWWYQYEWPFV